MRMQESKLRTVIREEVKNLLNEQPDTFKVTDVEGNEHIVPYNGVVRVVWSGESGGIAGSSSGSNIPFMELQKRGVEFCVVMDDNTGKTGEGAFGGGDIIGLHAERR